MSKREILLMADYYLPGYKAGGPIRSLANLVEQLGDDFLFKIVTRDRDIGDDCGFPGIRPDRWNSVGKAHVFYASPHSLSFGKLSQLFRGVSYDLLYVNSFFSPKFTLMPLLIKRFVCRNHTPIVIAPRGEFSDGALSIKAMKKKIYMQLFKRVLFDERMIWQASSEFERSDIQRLFGKVPILIAPDVPPLYDDTDCADHQARTKNQGMAKVLFLSRISPMKNLLGALDMLQQVKGEIQFDIYGPIDDPAYWEECQRKISQLPSHISVTYKGSVKHEEVFKIMEQYHLFFLPTLGENFGHVILEALLSGCPVLISDRTPWRNLSEKGAGWVLPIEESQQMVKVLSDLSNMDDSSFRRLSHQTKQYGKEYSKQNQAVHQNKQLFELSNTCI